jgi:hypothetical protein
MGSVHRRVINDGPLAGLDHMPVDLLAYLGGEVHCFAENAFAWNRGSFSREEELRDYCTNENHWFHLISLLFIN